MKQIIVGLSVAAVATLALPGVSEAKPDSPTNPKQWSDWQADDPSQFPPHTLDECGTTLTVVVGDEFATESRTRTRKDGTFEFQARGDFTYDVLVGEEVVVDELDISGRYIEEVSPDGVLTFTLYGPSAIFALNESERALFAETGLPDNFYFKSGLFKLAVDAETGEAIEILKAPQNVVDLCDLI